MDGGILYAELTIQTASDVDDSAPRQEQTQYAKLDFRKMKDSSDPSAKVDANDCCDGTINDEEDDDQSCLAPLMPNRMESCV